MHTTSYRLLHVNLAVNCLVVLWPSCFGPMQHNLRPLGMQNFGPFICTLGMRVSMQGVNLLPIFAIMLHIFKQYVIIAQVNGLATDILLSSLTTSKTLCLIISKTSSLVTPSLHTVIGNCSMANGKKYLMKNLFGHTSTELL